MATGDKRKFPTAHTGLDYARLTTTLAGSKLQKDNNSAYQTIQGIIDGTRKFQGFLEGKFDQTDSDLTRLFQAVTLITAELQERNSTKYSISLSNTTSQTLSDSSLTLCTFDKTIYDDGLMLVDDNTIQVHANAQFIITGRIRFAAADTGIRRVQIHLNGKRQFSSEFSALADEVITPFAGIIECLDGDLITLYSYQENGGDLAIIPSIQVCRLTFINMGSGRNLIEGSAGTSGDGGGGGGGSGDDDGTCSADTPPPSGPTFYVNILNAHNPGRCWNTTTLAAAEADFNALNYWYQRSSGGVIRGRLFYPTPTSFDTYADTNRPDGGWGWFPHGL